MGVGLRLSLLGKPHLSRDGAPVSGFIYNKALALLAYLAATGRPHSRDALAGLLWGEMPDAAAKANLRKILFVLREVAGQMLAIDRQTVAIAGESSHWVDTAVFEAQHQGMTAGAPGGPLLVARDARQLEDAVGLYRGDFLEGFYVRSAPAFEEWVLSERERFRQMALHSLFRLVGHYTAVGDYGRGLSHATRLLALEPWHEEVHQQVMMLLALSGQRSAALNQFEVCRRLLATELGAAPNRDTVELHRRIARGEVRAPPSPATMPSDWPAEATPFVGRTDELAKLTGHLAGPNCRLATVVGISGVGKTRLVLQAALRSAMSSGPAVYYVPVAGASSPEAIAQAVVRGLDVPLVGQRHVARQLISHLQQRPLLIVLDQLELSPGVPGFLHELLQQARQVRLLVACASRLGVAGEWVLPLYGLKAPESDDVGEVRRSEAVQLFMQAVQRVCGTCEFEDEQLAHVGRICRLVEGMPLAIELAAAWARVLPYHEIAQEIAQSYGFLTSATLETPAQHRSLAAAFDHSWSQMSAEERVVFRRLAVFRGGFARDAAEQVGGASLPILAALMDKCLLQRVVSGRYQVQGLLSQYGRRKLAELPEEEAQTYERYCAYYTAFLQRQMALLDAGEVKEPLALIAGERENVQAAWTWAAGRVQLGAGSHEHNGHRPAQFLAAKAEFDALAVPLAAR